MVSIRNQRRLSRSLRPSGTPSIRKEQKVRNNHDCSDKKADIHVEAEEKRSNHPEEQGRHHELERNLNVIGERQELLITDTEALSVPAKKPGTVEPADAMASPIDHVQSKRAITVSTTRVSMSSILEQRMKWSSVDLQPEKDLKVDIEQLELQRAGAEPSRPGLNRLPDFVFPDGDMEWPGVAADDPSDDVDGEDDEDDRLDPDWTIPEVENVQETSNDGSKGCSKLAEEFPSVKSGRGWLDFGDKEMSGIMSTCRQLAVNRKMTGAERMKYIFGSAIASGSHPQTRQGPRRIRREDAGSTTLQIPESIVRAEVPSPPVTSTLKRRHFLRSSCTVNNDLDEDHPLRKPEGSLPHSLYLQVLAYGQEGILLEDLLNSFHCQTLTAMLTDDWEDEVIDYLNHNPYFDQVQGHYLLSEFLVHPSPKRSAKGEEKGSPGSTIGFNQVCGEKRKVNGIQGSLEAKQAKIIANQGIQEGERRSLTALQPKGKQPWQCPIMAMEGQKFCEHHHKKRQPYPYPTVQWEAIDLTKSKRLSKEKEKESPNSATGFYQGFGGRKNMQIETSSKYASKWKLPICDKKPIKRGPNSLKAMQAKIIAKHGIQKGARPCALRNSRPWQCPMMAMEGQTKCEHHYNQVQAKKFKKSLIT